jgi:hypothetical protein
VMPEVMVCAVTNRVQSKEEAALILQPFIPICQVVMLQDARPPQF